MDVTSPSRIGRASGAAAIALALFLGCGGQEAQAPAPQASAPEPAPAPAPVAAADVSAEAAELYSMRCVTCHGTEGAGDGPGSAGLSPKPRDFRDPAWHAEVDDEHIANIVLYGGAAVGRSPTMPGNPDLTAKPDVVAALVAYVRDLESK